MHTDLLLIHYFSTSNYNNNSENRQGCVKSLNNADEINLKSTTYSCNENNKLPNFCILKKMENLHKK